MRKLLKKIGRFFKYGHIYRVERPYMTLEGTVWLVELFDKDSYRVGLGWTELFDDDPNWDPTYPIRDFDFFERKR